MSKRLFDWLASGIGLLILSPLFIILALRIKLDSPGPVFFRQERVGKGGHIFKIHKFRTMAMGSERQGPQITVGADPRVTREGQWLRKYKVDELPQLIDVWLGHMSFVGPRPEVPCYVAHYPDDIRDLVLSVRPGITDRASIEFKDESIILGLSTDPHNIYLAEVLPKKISFYIDYVNKHSFFGDIKIIFLTIREIIK
jgi:lipopolysaccharide/colanic/teichoic acid biosynthesis glycosyltransferase